MPDEIPIGTLRVDNAAALAALEAVEGALGTTIDRSQGLEAAIRSAGGAMLGFRGEVGPAASATEALGAAFRDAGAQAEDAGRKVGESAAQVRRAQQLFARGIGGRQLAAEISQVQRGIALLGEEGLSANTRLMALAGTFGMAARIGLQAAQVCERIGRALVEEAEAAERTHAQVVALGGALDAMRAATGGAITTTQAFAVQQGALEHNLVASDHQLAVLAEAGRRHARVFGGDATQATRQLEAAIASNDRNALARFGLSLQSATTAGGRFAGSMAELEAHQRAFGPLGASTAETVERVKTDFAELGQEVFTLARRFAEGTLAGRALTAAFNGTVAAVEATRDGLRSLNEFLDRHRSAEERARAAAEQHAAALQSEKLSSDDSARATQDLGGKVGLLTLAWQEAIRVGAAYKATLESTAFAANEGESAIDGLARRTEHARQALEQHRRQLAQDRQIAQSLGVSSQEDLAAAGLGDVAQADRRATRAGRTAERLQDTLARLHEIEDRAKDLGTEFEGLDRRRGESAQHYAQREIHALTEANQARQRDLTEQHHIDEQLEAIARRHAEKVAEDKRAARTREEQERRTNLAFDEATGRGARRTEAGDVLRELNTGAQTQEQILARIEALRGRAASAIRAGAADAHEIVASAQREAQALGGALQQFRQANEEARRSLADSGMTARLQSISAAVGGFTRALYDNIKALIAHKETLPEALRSIAESTLESIGTVLVAQGVKDMVTGISRGLSSYGFDATAYGLIAVGGEEIAAGIGFGAAGAAVGAIGAPAGGASSGGSSGGGAPSYANPASAMPGGSGGSGGGSATYNIYMGTTYDAAGAERQIHRSMRGLARLGHIAPGVVR